MPDLTPIEIKAFVPAKDFALSMRFYCDLGFEVASPSHEVACMRLGTTSFLLQNFPQGIDNMMMHLLVQDADAWWASVQRGRLVETYGVMIEPISDKPWGLRDFAISDPSGVLWRIGHNIRA